MTSAPKAFVHVACFCALVPRTTEKRNTLQIRLVGPNASSERLVRLADASEAAPWQGWLDDDELSFAWGVLWRHHGIIEGCIVSQRDVYFLERPDSFPQGHWALSEGRLPTDTHLHSEERQRENGSDDDRHSPGIVSVLYSLSEVNSSAYTPSSGGFHWHGGKRGIKWPTEDEKELTRECLLTTNTVLRALLALPTCI